MAEPQKFGVAVCRERQCPELQRDPKYPDSPETCTIIRGMPGAMPCCIKESDERMFIRRISARLNHSDHSAPRPGVRNCPKDCPYRIEKGMICGFTGEPMKNWGVCPCNVLGNPDQEHQIKVLKEIISSASKPVEKALKCGGEFCPDGIKRCGIGETICPVIKIPFAEMKICPLWRIPAKTLPQTSEKDMHLSSAATDIKKEQEKPAKTQKSGPEKVKENVVDPLCRHHGKKGCGIYSGIQDGVDTENCDGRNSENWCYVEPTMASRRPFPNENQKRAKVIREGVHEVREEKKRTRKEKSDPICEACRERMKGNVPAHACEWCREEQQQKGRRAWVTDIKLGSVLLGDMNEIGQRVPADSVDVIFTDPPYIKELYQQAYADLAELALRALKPHGFLFTYVPNAHLDEIMDMLRFTGTWRYGGKIQYFWSIQSLNLGPAPKAHKWNALCKHKQILVFQKTPNGGDIRGARRCFSDVVNGYRQKAYHPWQQSVHDVLGIIDRFMQPGEILLDPYAGTGTSLIAGQLLGMEVVGCEIDPNTHAIAVREMQQKPLGLIDEDLSPDTEREPAPELKEMSRQAGIEDPAKEARPVELKAACLRCKVRETCTTHAPYVNCKKIEAGKAAETAKQADTPLQLMRQDPDHDPHAGCLDAVKAVEGKEPKESCNGCKYDNCGPERVSGCSACLHPDSDLPGFWDRPQSECYTKKDVQSFEPFNIWQMRNCAACPAPGPCDKRDEYLKAFERDGPAALKDNCTLKEEVVGKVPEQPPAPSGGPTSGTCGTCGHHKGRKSFHETCPRLGELLFKGGTKSAKVLMEETQRDRCEHWVEKGSTPGEIYGTSEKPKRCDIPTKTTLKCRWHAICDRVGDPSDTCWQDAARQFAEACKWDVEISRCKECEAFGFCPKIHHPLQHLADKPAPKKKTPGDIASKKLSDMKKPVGDVAGFAKKVLETSKETEPITWCTPCKTWATCEQHKPKSDGCKAHRKTSEDLLKISEECPSDGKNGDVCGGCIAEQPCAKREAERQRISAVWEEKHRAEEKPAPKKKTPAKPRPYTIYIKRSDGNHPLIISCDSRRFGGTSNPCDTKEEAVRRGLIALDGFVNNVKKPSPTLAKKPLPVTIETTLFIDKTGLFTPADFFDAEGVPKKPVVEPKKKSKKKKEESES